MFYFESLKLNCCDGEEVGAPAHLGWCYLPSVILPQFTLCLYDPKERFCLMQSRGLGPRFFDWGRKLLYISINFTFGEKLSPDLLVKAFFQLFLTFDLLRISSSVRKRSQMLEWSQIGLNLRRQIFPDDLLTRFILLIFHLQISHEQIAIFPNCMYYWKSVTHSISKYFLVQNLLLELQGSYRTGWLEEPCGQQ